MICFSKTVCIDISVICTHNCRGYQLYCNLFFVCRHSLPLLFHDTQLSMYLSLKIRQVSILPNEYMKAMAYIDYASWIMQMVQDSLCFVVSRYLSNLTIYIKITSQVLRQIINRMSIQSGVIRFLGEHSSEQLYIDKNLPWNPQPRTSSDLSDAYSDYIWRNYFLKV